MKRSYANHERSASFHVALDRVEDEIARLTADAAAWERAAKAYASDVERMRQERNERNAEVARLREESESNFAAFMDERDKAVAAEQENARLREGLRRGAEGGETAEIRAWCSRLLSGETE